MPRRSELVAVVKPDVDDRSLDRATDEVNQSMNRAVELAPSIDTRSIRRKLERAIPGGGALGGVVDRVSGGGGGGRSATGGGGMSIGETGVQASQLEKLEDIHEELEKIGASGGMGGGGGGLGSTGLGFGLGSALTGGGGILGSIGAALSGSTAAGVAGGGLLGAFGVQSLSNLGVLDSAEDAGQATRENLPFGEEIGDAAQFLPGLSLGAGIEPLAFGDVGGAMDNFGDVWGTRGQILENALGADFEADTETGSELFGEGAETALSGGPFTGTEESPSWLEDLQQNPDWYEDAPPWLRQIQGDGGGGGGGQELFGGLFSSQNQGGGATQDVLSGGMQFFTEDMIGLEQGKMPGTGGLLGDVQSLLGGRTDVQDQAWFQGLTEMDIGPDETLQNKQNRPNVVGSENDPRVNQMNERLGGDLGVERGANGQIMPTGSGNYPDWAIEQFNSSGSAKNKARERQNRTNVEATVQNDVQVGLDMSNMRELQDFLNDPERYINDKALGGL